MKRPPETVGVFLCIDKSYLMKATLVDRIALELLPLPHGTTFYTRSTDW